MAEYRGADSSPSRALELPTATRSTRPSRGCTRTANRRYAQRVTIKVCSVSALLLTTSGSLVTSSAAGHHSWAAEYDLSRSTTIAGTVSRVMIRNPHSAVMLHVDNDGRREIWTVEWGSPQRLRERGITDRTLRQGDELLVTGNPHRNSKTRSLRALSVRGEDGNEIGDSSSANR